MKQKMDALQGTSAWMVLKTLDVLGSQHGYTIARAHRAGGVLGQRDGRESGIRMALGAQHKEVSQAALETGVQIAWFWFGGGIVDPKKLPREEGSALLSWWAAQFRKGHKHHDDFPGFTCAAMCRSLSE